MSGVLCAGKPSTEAAALASLFLLLSVSLNAQVLNDVDHYVWDLSFLYPDRRAWEAVRNKVEVGISTIGRFKNTMWMSAVQVAGGLDAISDLRSRDAIWHRLGNRGTI